MQRYTLYLTNANVSMNLFYFRKRKKEKRQKESKKKNVQRKRSKKFLSDPPTLFQAEFRLSIPANGCAGLCND